MQWLFAGLLLICTCSCSQKKKKQFRYQAVQAKNIHSYLTDDTSYADTERKIARRKIELNLLYSQAYQQATSAIENQIKDCWVNGIGTQLYRYWAGTPWDFNGTTRTPQQGTIACGYFVTTLLLNMGVQLNRIQLSTCAASEMMHRLVPHQKMKVLNNLSYNLFCDSLKHLGKGVYIIGLDFHVGFIVNDGLSCWFIYSNYTNRQGVTKEFVQLSAALQASNTRWLIDLTGDTDFIRRWLMAKPV